MKILEAIVQFAQDIKTLKNRIGGLATLKTSDKSNVINAINELYDRPSGGVSVDDTTPSSSNTYSSSKIDNQIALAKTAVKDEILNGAGAAFDTLKELEDALTSDKTATTALAEQVNKRLRFDEAQALTTEQKQQVATNLGLDDPTVNYLQSYLDERGEL